MSLRELIERLQRIEAEHGGDLKVGYSERAFSDYFVEYEPGSIGLGWISTTGELNSRPEQPLTDITVLVID